jgi:dTDP-4-amino-4,6-dideoxygalactose transaminase
LLNTKFSVWPSFSLEEANAVAKVLTSNKVNYWTGEIAREFEKEFAKWSNVKYAVALMNGTVALDLALKGINISPGDEVIVTPRTFLASVSCVVNAGGVPVFADVDINSGNLTANSIAAVLTKRTKAVICVHLAGWPCDMDPIMALADHHGFKVIEDCAQAHGASYKGRPVGSIGHVGAWSFCQDKIMTTGGEGGMVTTNDEKLWRAMWAYKDHGKSYEAVYERKHPTGFKWLHEGFGTNWRMLEMQAVIGRIQLGRMDDWAVARKRNAEAISAACNGIPALRVPRVKCGDCNGLCRQSESSCEHAYYKLYAYVQPEMLVPGWTRNRIIEEFNAIGVPCYQGICGEVYLEKAFDHTGWRPQESLTVAKVLGETSLMFLVHPTLTTEEISKTCEAIKMIMFKASTRSYLL